MEKIEQRRLGPAGIEWVRRGLTRRRLGELILARHSLDGGVTVALVPGTVTDQDAHDFEGSVLKPLPPEKTVFQREPDGSVSRLVPIPNTNPHLVGLIRDFLRRSSSHVCVFEDYIQSADELPAGCEQAGIMVLDGVLYHVIESSKADEPTIMATVLSAHFIHMTLGVLGSQRRGDGASQLDLTELVAGLDTIIVDAYDGESYVLWRPS